MFCLLRGGAVAREAGWADVALERAQGARRELERAPLRSRMLELRVLMDLAETYRASGQPLAASAAFERSAALLSELGRARTATAGTLFNNWALALYRLGRPLDAERIMRRAIELSRTDTTDAAVSPMLLVNYGRVLNELQRLDEAASFAERAYAKALDAGQEVVINQSLLLRSGIYLDQGKLADAATLLDEVEQRLRTQLPPGHIAFGSLSSERGLLAQARGEPRAALDLTNRAIEIVKSSVQSGDRAPTSCRSSCCDARGSSSISTNTTPRPPMQRRPSIDCARVPRPVRLRQRSAARTSRWDARWQRKMVETQRAWRSKRRWNTSRRRPVATIRT
jgi:tetratricopeptide (TPR) repeat protein